MKKILHIALMIALALPMTMIMIATPAEAKYTSMYRSSASKMPAYRTATPKTTTFRTVRSVPSVADGGSSTLLYAAAYLAIINSQSKAADNGAPVRDTQSLATYGLKGDISKDFTALYAFGGAIFFLFAVFGLIAFVDNRAYRY